MVEYYVKRINQGKMTLDRVPELWRAEVEKRIREAGE